MRANAIQTLFIKIKSLYYMICIISYVIFFHLIGKLNRKRVDDILHWWAKKLLNVIKLKYSLHNPNNVDMNDGEKYVVMSNHSSLYDIPLIYASINKSIRMIAKKELAQIPFFGSAMRAGEIPIIDRFNREKAIKSLQYAQQLMESGLIIWIYPEGTRSRTGNLLPLKKGGFVMAIESGATIIPVGLRNTSNILPTKTWNVSTHMESSVNIGKPIKTTGYNLENKEQLMQEVASEIKKLSGESN